MYVGVRNRASASGQIQPVVRSVRAKSNIRAFECAGIRGCWRFKSVWFRRCWL